ncbi:MAG: alpha-2-macroglobulin family protein, partial [Flavisolibacter sp.]
SSISFINQKNIFFVLDRESGQPLVNASATVYGREYDYNTSRYKKTRRASYTTDMNGSFVVATAASRQEYDYFLDLAYKGDSLGMNEFIYDYSNQSIEVPKPTIFFFTDRSIYRPGQSVFFKGIAIDKGSKKIAENYSTIIYLRNVNYKIVDSIKVSSNEFGSFNGKFVIPQSGLNGNYQLVTADGNNATNFSVEEYKRPKFHIEFDTTGKSYKVNEQITVRGNAKAYAGNNVQGAKVSYRVVRQPRMIYSWFSRWFPPAPPLEIAHGETITDNDGVFSIQFNALPDRTIDSTLNPLFDYIVNVDVTERNGETRSGTKRITAGYSSLLLQINLPEKLAADSIGNLPVKTMNMNNQLEPSLVTVTMTKLIPEQRLIRKRYWDQPDLFVMSKQEYISKFPHDEYKDETDYHSWLTEETVFEKSDSTSSRGVLFPQIRRMPAGFYLVQFITHDKAGKEIKDARLVELVQTHSKTFTKPEYLWATTDPVSVDPGIKATVSVGSSAPGIFLINQVERPQYSIANDSSVIEIEKELAFKFYDLHKEKKDFDFVPTEVDRGGIGVNFFFVKDNRFYQYNKVIDVPWTNKQLTIEYSSFREKIKPGTEEKWSIKIKGIQKERIAAEVLASMYDASLDQFRMHSWASPDLWPSLLVHPWTSSENFTGIDLTTYRYYAGRQINSNPKIYDVLSFGDDRKFGLFTGNGGLGYRVAREMAPAMSDTKYKEVSNQAVRIRGNAAAAVSVPDTVNNEEVVPRKNFNETAFFFPNFRTDSSGAIEFAVTVPEALSTWKLQLLAHTRELAFGSSTKELVTQKEIMVQPNIPRFVRQGDHIEFATTIVNLSDSERTGQVQLELFDATTNQSVDGWFINSFSNQYFTVAAGQSEIVKFPIQVPFQFNKTLVWRITARSGN